MFIEHSLCISLSSNCSTCMSSLNFHTRTVICILFLNIFLILFFSYFPLFIRVLQMRKFITKKLSHLPNFTQRQSEDLDSNFPSSEPVF